MERLTKRVGNTVDFANGKANLTDHKSNVKMLFERLADYEDMNLTADEVRDNASAFANDRAYFFEEKEKMQEEIKELKQDCEHWKREALKWANKLGEQRIERELKN